MSSLWFLLVAFQAKAADTSALAAQRWQANQKIAFYCEVGRPVIQSSDEALLIEPNKSCTYHGPLDSKLPVKNLQPPFLNPRLTRADLKAELEARAIPIDRESASALVFHLASGESFTARDLAARSLEDTLLHLGAYPSAWGKSFVSISGPGPQAFRELAKQMAGSALFWSNPHRSEEAKARAKFNAAHDYLPLPVISKCDPGALAAVRAPVLVAGDMHSASDAQYVTKLLNMRPFAWIALEITRDRRSELDAFLTALTPADEDAHLARVVDRLPSDLAPQFMNILRFAKTHQLKVILLDYSEAYFNFPFTDTAFHGSIIATRNLMWASQIPSSWGGTGLVFAGLAHFTDTPGADFQNFLRDRFPSIQILFLNPLEKCMPSQLLGSV